MKTIAVLLICVLIGFVIVCRQDRWSAFQRELNGFSDERAFSEFRKLSAQDKVDFYVWQIEHSRPPASRFELILKESGGETVVLLLDRAKTTRQYFTSVAILRYLAALPVEDMKYIQRAKVDSAIENCLSLEGSSAQSICKDDGSELRKRLIAE